MNLLDLLATLDMIDKADALIRGAWFVARGRGVHTLEFTPPVGSAPADCERWLYRRGVAVFGRGKLRAETLPDGRKAPVFVMRCSAKQAGWAEYTLMRGGALVWNPTDPANGERAARYQYLPPAWADRRPGEDPGPAKPAPAAPKRGSSGGLARRAMRDLWG